MSKELSSGELKFLKSVMQSDAGTAILDAAQHVLTEWYKEPVSGTNEFQTLRCLHLKEGKIAGLEEFIKFLENNSFK